MEHVKIAVIDDDVAIGDLLEEVLTREGYAVSRAYSGTEALLLLEREKPALVLLDLMLPGLNGEEVLSKIGSVPVIIVSARADVDDKVKLLSGGAMDYVTKPFDTKELLARIGVQLRSGTRQAEETLLFGEIALNNAAREVTVSGEVVKLTRTEYAILRALMENHAGILSKNAIMEAIERDTPDCEESSLKTHVGNLRNKLRKVSGRDHIEAVWGIGYKLKS